MKITRIAPRGADRDRSGGERKERERETDWKKRRKREQVRYASRDFRHGRRRRGGLVRAAENGAYPLERIPVAAGATQPRDRCPSLLPFSRHGRDRAYARGRMYITLSARPGNATRDAKRRRGSHAADLARVTPLSKEANRAGERCTVCGTFSPLMRDTIRIRDHFCFHSECRCITMTFVAGGSFVSGSCTFVNFKARRVTYLLQPFELSFSVQNRRR